MDGYALGQQTASYALAEMDRMPTAREQLTSKKRSLEQKLGDVNAALEALDANPEIEKVLTLVGRTVRF